MIGKIILAIDQLEISCRKEKPADALKAVESVSIIFLEDLSTTETDLSISRVFDSDHSLLSYLKKSLRSDKLFKDANAKTLQLLQKLIKEHPGKAKAYAQPIVEVVLNYVLSSTVSAVEKDNAVLVIHELVVHKLCENVNVTALLSELIKVFNLKKPPARFLQHTFELLGLLARDYSTCIANGQAAVIFKMFLTTLEATVLKQNENSFASLTGALVGLNYFMCHFAPCPGTEHRTCQQIYACIKKLSDPPDDCKDLTLFRAALNLLAEHATIVSEQVFLDHQYWHTVLHKWLTKSSWENRKCAIYALQAVHREISIQIELRKNPSDDTVILKTFINYFKTTMQSATAQSYEIRIAIQGFGLMAGPCKALLPPEYLNDLLTLVMQRTEYTALEQTNKGNEMLEHYPDFVQALSQIMQHVAELTGIQIASLQNIVIALIKDFYYLSRAHHSLAVQSLLRTFANLARLGGSVLDSVLERVVLQGVIWTCSHKLVYDSQNDWETIADWKEQITYKSFLPLWIGLVGQEAVGNEERAMITAEIYDHAMRAMFSIVDRLDLRTNKRSFKDDDGNDNELYFCDPNYDLVPHRPKDFHIFFNIVQFYRDLLYAQNDNSHRKRFVKYLQQYCELMVHKALEYPLISGFVRLMQLALHIIDRIGYFTDTTDVDRPIRATILYFLQHHIESAPHIFGELQIASLDMIFSAPVELLQPYMIDVIPIFVVAFDIGKSLLSLARRALRMLEKLQASIQEFGVSEWQRLLRAVLPCLDPYLQSNGFPTDGNMNVEVVNSTRRSTKRAQKVLRVDGAGDTELVAFQKKILIFLGTLEPESCLYLISSELRQPNLTKLDVEQSIKLTLNFPDMKPHIYLDTLIPRICTIATTSIDRKTKIAACELTHAIVLFLLGRERHHGIIWQELCTHLLRLACDGDVAVQQMFEPLLMQIMHFMSNRNQLLGPGVTVLFDCLMEGISHPSNAAVRDMAARCLREFMQYSIKQSTPEQVAASPTSLVGILSKLKEYCFDSAHEKRAGAALAFNNLYRIVREEDAILDYIWLDMLYAFAINFLMSEELTALKVMVSTDGEHNFTQVSTSLDHVARVICERRTLFNRSNDQRVVPHAFGGSTLRHAVLWLFEQCGAKQQHYRSMCIRLVQQLAPLVDGFVSLKAFVSIHTVDTILLICEGHPQDGTGIAARPDLRHIGQVSISPLVAIFTWLQHFHSALDTYIWLLGEGLVGDVVPMLERSTIFSVISYYLNNVCCVALMDLITGVYPSFMENMHHDKSDYIIDIGVMDRIEQLKCVVVVRIFDFLLKMLPICHRLVPAMFWNDCSVSLISVTVQLIYAPQDLGFDFKSLENAKQLPQTLNHFIDAIQTLSPTTFSAALNKKLQDELENRYKETSEHAAMHLYSATVPKARLNNARGINMMCGRKDASNLSHSEKLLQQLFDGLKEEHMEGTCTVRLNPDVTVYANVLINISFHSNPFAVLVDLMLDPTELMQRNNTSDTTKQHGQYFIETFKRSIFEYLLRSADTTIAALGARLRASNMSNICNLFIDLCAYVHRYRQHDQRGLQMIVRGVLQLWPQLMAIDVAASTASMGTPSTTTTTTEMTAYVLVELLAHIALICPYKLSDIRSFADGLTEWVLAIPLNKHNSLELKSRVIFLLPCVVDESDVDHSQVRSALEALQLQFFPLRSNEFAVGSLERSAFVNIFQTILDAFVASRSLVILRFLINSTAADTKHILEYNIRKALTAFMARLTNDQQTAAMSVPFEFFVDTNLEPSIRQAVVQRFLVAMLRSGSCEAVADFYTQRMRTVFDLCGSNYSTTSSGWMTEHALVNRIGAYQLVELLFAVVPQERLQNKERDMNATMRDQNTELIKVFTKITLSTRSENCVRTNDSTVCELFRLYQCAAYRAICAIISNTQTTLKFYESFLFKENPTKNDWIWSKIIDCTNDELYRSQLGHDFDEYPKRKERIVSIRQLAQCGHDTITKSAKYLQSQSVFESSLSQDVTKIDLSCSSIRTDAEVARIEQASSHIGIVHLERVAINDHEAMPIICAVIEHMFAKDITPHWSDPTMRPTRIAPQWAEHLCKVLSDSGRHRNVRYFMAKLIENCRDHFRHYAASMSGAVLKFLSDECDAPAAADANGGGATLNYFIHDLCVMLLEWSDVYKIGTPEETSAASGLLRFLMLNAWHDRKEIFKQHLELIKCVIEQWRDVLVMPKQLLFDSINRSQRNDSRANACGIQLNAIVLANNLVPWTTSTAANFLQLLMRCLDNEHANIYQSAAQLIGMCLQQLIAPDESDNESFSALLSILVKLKLEHNQKKFTDILFGVHKNYPIIVDSFLVTISNYISTSSGAIKRAYLEMYLSRMDVYGDEIFREIMSVGIVDLLKTPEYQLYALHIVNKALPRMSAADVRRLLPELHSIVDAKQSQCRDVIYEIYQFVLVQLETNLAFVGNGELQAHVTAVLLCGLNDTDIDIQTRLFNFWSADPKRLSANIEARILTLLDGLYDPSAERHFLNYSTQLMLEPAIQHPDSRVPLFPQHVTEEMEEKLKEYDINVSWKTQNSTLTAPLFMESQQRHITTGNVTAAGQHFLRATITSLAFEPTLDPLGMMSQTAQQFSLQTQSSLLFSVEPQVLNRRSERVQSAAASAISRKTSFSHLRQRFLRDRDKTNRAQALRAVDRHDYKQVQQSQAKQKKERHVTLYRRYRTGEYPDLMINSLALLMPLKGLVKYDKLLARQVLVAIFESVVSSLEAPRQFVLPASESIQRIFAQTKRCDTVVFAALMELALSHAQHFNIPAELVATFSSAHQMMAMGIMYLENRLHCSWDTDDGSGPSSSKRSTVGVEVEELHWLKLSALYRDLSEQDVVAGIFTDKLSVGDDKMSTAISLELTNDIESARQMYAAIIVRANVLEKHFAYESYYKLYEIMGDWSALSKECHLQIETYDELWDDWNVEFLLPHIIRAQLHLILAKDTHSVEFLKSLETWIRTPDKSTYLSINFGEELMMLHVANQQYRHARVYAEQHFNTFLSEWQNLTVLSGKVRSNKLLATRTVAEMFRYTDLLLMADKIDSSDVTALLRRWSTAQPQLTDSTKLWDAILSYRRYVCDMITASGSPSVADVNVRGCLVASDYRLLDVALHQRNNPLSNQILQRLYSVDPSPEWLIARSRQQSLKALRAKLPQSQINLHINAWKRLKTNVLLQPEGTTTNVNVQRNALEELSAISARILDIVMVENSVSQLQAGTLQVVQELTQIDRGPNLDVCLLRFSIKCMQQSIALYHATMDQSVDQSTASSVSACGSIANAYLKLAEYCQIGYSNEQLQGNIKDIERTIVDAVLKAMQYGSYEARQLFPRILQLKELETDSQLRQLFNDRSRLVPEWMFLRWSPQIISSLTFDRPSYLDELLVRLATTYPTAILYPFQLAYKQEQQLKEFEPRNIVLQIQKIIDHPKSQLFIKSLMWLCVPEKLLIYHLNSLFQDMQNDEHFSNTMAELRLRAIIDIVWPSNDVHQLRGKAFDRINVYREQIEALLGIDVYDEEQRMQFALHGILKELDNTAHKSKGNKNYTLKSFSPWLHRFQWCGEEDILELPGQYMGERRPCRQDHVRLVKFNESIEIFETLRQPIKLTMHGNDGRAYSFVIKYGEDVRQDQRIEQLLALMSTQMAGDKNCRNHSLQIETFAVIPISTYCGMLSWVLDTLPMRGVLEKSFRRRQPNAMQKLNHLRQQHQLFIRAPSKHDEKSITILHYYGKAIETYTRTEIINTFRTLENGLPEDMVRCALRDLCQSPESYFAFRNNFATSLATMNVAHWLLGIGDRHLGNMLLNIKTGRVVGIDFGLCFGAGTQDQNVPEMIPFRLTPHFVAAMSPLGVTGLITKCMAHSLRCFQSAQTVLMACMEVFVKEPTIGWLVSARNKNDADNVTTTITSTDGQWNPMQRILVVQKKLTGANPTVLIEEELKSGIIAKYPKYLEGYLKLLKGIDSDNIRARLSEAQLTADDQVKCLLDLAQDPALLGMCFTGFAPWI